MPLIVHSCYLGPGRLTIKRLDAENYLIPRAGRVPHQNFLHKAIDSPTEIVAIDQPLWNGRNSDSSYIKDAENPAAPNLPDAFALTKGEAIILFAWDDGTITIDGVTDGKSTAFRLKDVDQLHPQTFQGLAFEQIPTIKAKEGK